MRCKQKRKFIATTDSAHALPIAPNLLSRQFISTAPNKARLADITYIETDEGWLYLAGIKDVFNGELVGYAMADNMACLYGRLPFAKIGFSVLGQIGCSSISGLFVQE